jgi:hypothetical protein
MADDNVTPIDKQSKDPKLAGLNKLREQASKELNTKIEAQVKKTFDAQKIYKNEKATLVQLLSDAEEAKAELSEFADILKGI